VEIALFTQTGAVFGFWWTMFLVLLSAACGIGLLRWQGTNALRQAQATLSQGRLSLIELLDRFFLMVSGGFLLLPGFFTDAVGVALLLPFVRWILRNIILARLMKTGKRQSASQNNSFSEKSTVIDATYVVEDPPTSDDK
tara:strand:- start:531 stop:950 length:420 start_codon:yes stop_codon:yes gene_type:complete